MSRKKPEDGSKILKSQRFIVKEMDEEKGTFEGYASVFKMIDFGGDMVMPGAFSRSLETFKERGELPFLMWQHNMSEPIGEYKEMYEDQHGLYVKGQLWLELERAKQAYRVLTSNNPKQMSIGALIKQKRMAKVDDRTCRQLLELELLEVSLVPYGMCENAEVLSVKDRGVDVKSSLIERPAIYERILREVGGLSQKQAKAFLAKGYPGLREMAKDRRDVDCDKAKLLAEQHQLLVLLAKTKGSSNG